MSVGKLKRLLEENIDGGWVIGNKLMQRVKFLQIGIRRKIKLTKQLLFTCYFYIQYFI